MKEKVIIYGISDFSEYVFHFISRDNQVEVIAFTVDSVYKNKTIFCEKPVIDFENLEIDHPPSDCKIFIAIGTTNMNKLRDQYCNLARNKGYDLFNYISKHAIVSGTYGDNNFIGDFSVVNPKSKIGNGNIIYEHCILADKSVVGNNCYIAPKAVIGSLSEIKDYSVIGMNTVINTEIIVAEESLIGAQSYISQNTKYRGVYGMKSTPLYGCNSDKIINLI